MQTKFKVSFKNRELGPLTEAQIQKMIAGNQLALTDKFFSDDKQDWRPLSEIFPPAQAAQPAPEIAEFEEVEMIERTAIRPKPTAPPAALAKQAVPAPTPAPATVKAQAPVQAKPQSKPAETSDSKVKLDAGVGTLTIKQLKSGPVSLKLKTDSGLEVATELSLIIQAAPASQIKWELPTEGRAGDEFSIELKAFDAFANLAVDFGGSVEIQLSGKENQKHTVHFEQGLGSLKCKWTRAEELSVQASAKGLELPETHQISISPNVPVKLVAQAPKEARAGDNIDLKITALDAFDNVVTDFKGEIDLKVEAHPLKKAG